jgi:hypothetical protein
MRAGGFAPIIAPIIAPEIEPMGPKIKNMIRNQRPVKGLGIREAGFAWIGSRPISISPRKEPTMAGLTSFRLEEG